MIEELAEAVREKQAILFVGAGVSMNLGVPSWKDLIDEMARKLEYDPKVFELYGNNLELAEFYKIKETTLDTLCDWMDREWHKNPEKVADSRVHQAITQLDFPTIYTTNFDRWLEIAFEERGIHVDKIANVDDFTKIRDGVCQIVKLHGDVEDADSLVLTETSYFERLDFESPLDIKLRSDVIGKTILFVGYGLSDINIRYLLYKLQCMWAGSADPSERPKSYIFLAQPNRVQEAILERRGIVPIVSDTDDPAKGLETFMAELLRKARGISL